MPEPTCAICLTVLEPVPGVGFICPTIHAVDPRAEPEGPAVTVRLAPEGVRVNGGGLDTGTVITLLRQALGVVTTVHTREIQRRIAMAARN